MEEKVYKKSDLVKLLKLLDEKTAILDHILDMIFLAEKEATHIKAFKYGIADCRNDLEKFILEEHEVIWEIEED